VRSLKCPTIGWISSPVSGAAIQRIARLSTSAPRVWKMRLVLAFWSPNPIWIPKKPTHMFQIARPDRRGRTARGGA
ncbi:hypothetical protein LTR94_034951, partial [Friedmanniomyces endolithicus]